MKNLFILLLPVLVFAQEKTFKQYIRTTSRDLVNKTSVTHVAVAYGKGVDYKTVLHFGESSSSTMYDLASLTKIFTSLLFVLMEQESVVSRKVPLFKAPRVTFEDLLRHRAGLPISTKISKGEMPEMVWRRIFAMRPKAYLVGKFRYSDINYLILGNYLAKQMKTSLDKLMAKKIFDPLQMGQTKFAVNIPEGTDCPVTDLNISPCHVHDPKSYKLGSLTGHAGLFASVNDLVTLAREILASLRGEGIILSKSAIESILFKDKNGRYIGFDSESAYARRPTGNFSWSKSSFGHTGFTGTSLFIDPEKKEYLIILTNGVLKKFKGDLSKKKYFDYLEKASMNFTRLQK